VPEDARQSARPSAPAGYAERNSVSFGPFRLFADERLLEREGASVHIGGRALDILIALAERAGEVVSKTDLFATVWPDVTVDEGSLRFHVTALRKALGDGQSGARYIVNAPGRGYALVTPVSRPGTPEPARAAPPPAPVAPVVPRTLPVQLTRMIGRADTIQRLSDELALHRFVTLVGPGGIGKTTVAVTVGHARITDFGGMVCFVDLGSLSDARLVASELASTLGLAVSTDDPVPNLIAFLQDKRMLLIFDSCEHVIDTLAPLAETIFKAAPQIHILATSRESLRVEGEHVHRLFPLECPPQTGDLTASNVLAFPAAELFVERISASLGQFALSDSDAPVVAEICAKLDGIALAIELAAGRVSAYGIQGIATLLNGRFALLWQGRRTAVPRHQTLSAALAWSYDLLPPTESAILRRLSVFVGPFTLEASLAVAASDDSGEPEIIEAIASLVAKSLVAADGSSRRMRYRLLDSTRAYVAQKQAESGEADRTARQHAAYFTGFLARLDTDDTGQAGGEGFAAYSDQLGNVRAALDWSFSASGDPAIGIDLAAAASQFFIALSLLIECHQWADRAISILDASTVGSHREMELQGSLAVALMFTQGNTEQVRAAFVRAIELARSLGDARYEIQLLRGYHIYLTRLSDFRGSLHLGERSEVVAKLLNNPADTMMAAWMVGVAHHLIGNQREAVTYCESAMTGALPPRQSYMLRLGYDDRIIALVALARGLWLGGHPDRAVAAARFTIRQAELLEQPLTLGIAMVWVSYVFLWFGDWTSAEAIIERLIAHAAKYSLGPYNAVGLGLKGELLIRRGEPAAGVPLLRRGLATLEAIRHRILITAFTIALAEGLVRLEQIDEALAALDAAIAQNGPDGESFDVPEMFRLKGAILAASARPDAGEAESWLRKSLEWARKQHAVAWELRTAISLVPLLVGDGRVAEARALLAPLHASFKEGFDSVDLKAASALLEELASAAT
jgi:predicted ATPase/DNA-binding winged helix-turn-helix (wHTH) protein